jgi:hypothetical protein
MANTYETKGTSELSKNLMQLPIMKHFEKGEMTIFKGGNQSQLKKGAVPIYNILRLIGLVALGYAFVKYALPQIMVWAGVTLGAVASVAIVFAAIMCAPAYNRWMKTVARNLHKKAINQDPFLQFEIDRKKIIQNNEAFKIASGKIKQLRSEMEMEASRSEKDAEAFQKEILKLQAKAERLKNEMDKLVQERGSDIKGEDEYVERNSELLKTLSEATRMTTKMHQSKDFVQKFGSRGAIMKKLSQRLRLAETGMEIKLADFDATVEMLKKDFEFSQKSREATDAAKSAMLFNKSWELEYAMDVVTSSIAEDIAITSGNLRDIDSVVSQYSLDSDELYENLNLLADNIKAGKEEIPDAKHYRNEDVKLTQDDKIKSGGMSNIFD